MKKVNKKLKGMTLIEMIISIAIFAIMGGLLILVGTHIDATNKATNVLKNKVAIESPYAANHVTKYTNKAGDPDNLPSSKVEVEVKVGSADVKMEADKYATEALVTDGLTAAEKAAVKKKANGNLNLQFIEITPSAPAGGGGADPAAGGGADPAAGGGADPAAGGSGT